MNELAQEWYEALVEDCKAIITECEFTSRWALIEGYHELGRRILQDNHNFEREKIYGKEIVKRVSTSIGKGERVVRKSVQFAKTYPDLSLAPITKDKPLRYVFNELLPEPKTATPLPLPEGEFNVIYADPPWRYGDNLVEGYGASEHHYPSMSIEELCSLQVPSARDAALFVWATSPLLEDVFKVINAWGFSYKTSFVWDKVKHNFGHYNSVRHELLLVCTKGSFPPATEVLRDSVVTEERAEHSRKPDVFYGIIEEIFPEGKYLEMFARNKRDGWVSWGNEV